MRHLKVLTGVALGTGLLVAGVATAQSTSGVGGTTQGNDNTSVNGSDQMKPSSPAGSSAGDISGSSDTKAAKQVSGTVSSVGNDKFVLNSDDGSSLTLRTDSATKIFDSSGNAGSISQLKEGEQIRASYDLMGSENHATRIDVIKTSPSDKK